MFKEKMITVGVLTMHRVINYGSVLQAFATQHILKQLGYNPTIIDYIYPNKYHSPQSNIAFRSFLSKIYHLIFPKPEIKKRNHIIKFYKENLHLSQEYKSKDILIKNPPTYDIYLIGSDQVWNPTYMKGDETFLLGFINNDKKKISFSSSFSVNEIPNEYIDKYKYLLDQFNHLSVRENNGKNIVYNLLGKTVPVTLDPTLMLPAKVWKTICDKNFKKIKDKNYILLYMLDYAFKVTPYIYNLLFDLQKKTGLHIYSFTRLPKKYENKKVTYIIDSSPIDFLQSFENASFVVTSSFHGTAFAINYGIPLYSIVSDNPSNDDRQTSLLSSLGLHNNIFKVNDKFRDPRDIIFDKNEINIKLNKLREKSLEYLTNSLKY